MRTLEEYMSLNYPMEISEDKDDGGYAVRFPDLPGCLSCGRTIEDAIANAEMAKRIWFQSMIEDNKVINEPSESAENDIVIRMPKSLSDALTDNAKEKGLSLNLYCVSQLYKSCQL